LVRFILVNRQLYIRVLDSRTYVRLAWPHDSLCETRLCSSRCHQPYGLCVWLWRHADAGTGHAVLQFDALLVTKTSRAGLL